MLSRSLAFLVGVVGLAALRGQYDALGPPVSGQTLPQQLWFMAGSYGNLTALAVTAHMMAVARGWQIGPSRAAGLVVAMAASGALFHAGMVPGALDWRADQGLHTAMPLAVLLWWLGFAARGVAVRDLPLWLIWPVVFGVYAAVRGDVPGGWAVVGPVVAGVPLGLAIVGLARIRSA